MAAASPAIRVRSRISPIALRRSMVVYVFVSIC
ncbi:hypothetical protein SMICM17S_04510 [Streptomyces microflavus]